MKVILEIICFPITCLIWIISFIFMVIFCFDTFHKLKKGTKNYFDVFLDINMLIYQTSIVDVYFSISPYIRTLISIFIYYNLL